MTNREWGQIGNNYLKSLFAIGFQGFLIMICVGIDVYKRQFYMSNIELLIGQSSTEAERKRAARLQNKALSAPRTNGGHLSDIRPPKKKPKKPRSKMCIRDSYPIMRDISALVRKWTDRLTLSLIHI